MISTWGHIQSLLKDSLTPGLYKVWISPLAATVEGTTLHLEAPNGFVARSVRERLLDSIQQAANSAFGTVANVVIEAGVSSRPEPAKQAESPSVCTSSASSVLSAVSAPVTPPIRTTPSTLCDCDSVVSVVTRQAPVQVASHHTMQTPPAQIVQLSSMPQTPQERVSRVAPASVARRTEAVEQLGLPLDWAPASQSLQVWRFAFEDFITGPSNELAFAAARGMCHEQLITDTLFINSGPGLGKTHLLHAVGHALCGKSNRTNPKIECLTAEEFGSRLVASFKARDVERFKARYRDVDVLLLEDVHFLQGKEKMQDEVLATLKSLQSRGSRVAFSSSFAPRELRNVDSQLVSRFGSGFIANIEKPDFDTRRRIFDHKARVHQVTLPDSVAELLAERVSSDIRQIESCLHNLVLKAKLLNQPISVDMAWDIIGNYAAAEGGVDFDTIVRLVCEAFGLSHDQLNSRSRKREYVVARNAAYLLARKHTDLSLKEIGDRFNRRHSTVLKGITALEREINRETPLGRQVASTLSLLERNGRISTL